MKKRLILITTILAIVSGALFAAQTVTNSVSSAFNDATATNPTTDTTHVVADSPVKQFNLVLEAENGTTWTDTTSNVIYDSTWNVRTGFNVDFRIRAAQGSFPTTRTITSTITVDPLVHDGDGSIEAGSGTVTLGDVGGKFSTTFAAGAFSTTTTPRYYYGVSGNEADDSFGFNIEYAASSTAPAGRYTSEVTIEYAVN
ncbi:MAG: hypothetical protein ACPKOI_05050 [Pleomorphochaeta sp.]